MPWFIKYENRESAIYVPKATLGGVGECLKTPFDANDMGLPTAAAPQQLVVGEGAKR